MLFGVGVWCPSLSDFVAHAYLCFFCLLQALALHQEWSSEKAQRIQLTDRLVKKEVKLADQVMLNDANQNTIRYLQT